MQIRLKLILVRSCFPILREQLISWIKTSTENWKFMARGSYNTHSDYRVSGGDRVTNTRYNETDFKSWNWI
jgi:hypothetical protein